MVFHKKKKTHDLRIIIRLDDGNSFIPLLQVIRSKLRLLCELALTHCNLAPTLRFRIHAFLLGLGHPQVPEANSGIYEHSKRRHRRSTHDPGGR